MEKTIDTKEKLDLELTEFEIDLYGVSSLLFVLKEFCYEKMSEGKDIASEKAHEAITHIFNSLEVIYEKLEATTDDVDRKFRSAINSLIKTPVEGK